MNDEEHEAMIDHEDEQGDILLRIQKEERAYDMKWGVNNLHTYLSPKARKQLTQMNDE